MSKHSTLQDTLLYLSDVLNVGLSEKPTIPPLKGVSKMTNGRYEDGKFYTIPNNIYRAITSVYELTVLLYLLQCADTDGNCFPKQETIAQGIMSPKQVSRCANAMIKRGLIGTKITWEKGHRKTHYHINFDLLITITNQTASPLDCQSTRLPVHYQLDCQSTTNQTASPINHTNSNHTQLTKPNSSNIGDFNKFLAEQKTKYPNLDIDQEWADCQLWWSEQKRSMKYPKSAFNNWLKRAGKRPNASSPAKDRYSQGKYADLIQRDTPT